MRTDHQSLPGVWPTRCTARGRIFQAGTQRRSVSNYQQAVALAHSGKLGKLHTLYASVYVPEIKTDWLPGEPTPAREACDWNLWLGPAPWRPYNGKYVAGGWRGYYEFDSGARLLDWGITRSTYASGPTRPTIRCRLYMNLRQPTSRPITPMG